MKHVPTFLAGALFVIGVTAAFSYWQSQALVPPMMLGTWECQRWQGLRLDTHQLRLRIEPEGTATAEYIGENWTWGPHQYRIRVRGDELKVWIDPKKELRFVIEIHPTWFAFWEPEKPGERAVFRRPR